MKRCELLLAQSVSQAAHADPTIRPRDATPPQRVRAQWSGMPRRCVVCDPTVHNVGGPPGVASPVRIYDCRKAPRSHSTVACSMRGCSTLIRTHRTSSVHRILTNPCCKGDIRHRSNIRGHARRDLAARGLVSGVGGGLVGVEHQGRGASGRALLRGRCGSRLLVRHSRNGHG